MSSTNKTASDKLREEMAACWQWRMETDPELAAAMGLLSKRHATHALDPRSLDSFAQRLAWLQAALDRVRNNIKREELDDESDRLSYDLYVGQLSDYCSFTPKHKAYLCCINRLEGPYV